MHCPQVASRLTRCLRCGLFPRPVALVQTLLEETSEVWINLHHLFRTLDAPVAPRSATDPLPAGSLSFVWGSERSGFMHLYLYTFVPGVAGATLVRRL